LTTFALARIYVRPVQAEYFMTKLPDGLNNLLTVRISPEKSAWRKRGRQRSWLC